MDMSRACGGNYKRRIRNYRNLRPNDETLLYLEKSVSPVQPIAPRYDALDE